MTRMTALLYVPLVWAAGLATTACSDPAATKEPIEDAGVEITIPTVAAAEALLGLDESHQLVFEATPIEDSTDKYYRGETFARVLDEHKSPIGWEISWIWNDKIDQDLNLGTITHVFRYDFKEEPSVGLTWRLLSVTEHNATGTPTERTYEPPLVIGVLASEDGKLSLESWGKDQSVKFGGEAKVHVVDIVEGQSVKVPAGAYDNAFKATHFIEALAVESWYIAPNVGVVRVEAPEPRLDDVLEKAGEKVDWRLTRCVGCAAGK